MELVAARIRPEPFTNLQSGFACPGAYLAYSIDAERETVDMESLTRALPEPTQDETGRLLRGYDPIASPGIHAPLFLLRPASNLKSPDLRDSHWLTAAKVEEALARLPAHQVINVWQDDSRAPSVDRVGSSQRVARRGHTLVIH